LERHDSITDADAYSVYAAAIPQTWADVSKDVADDARLGRMYPGTMQYRPESMKYAAVSAVGFNAGKTKAIVSVRLRSMRGMVDIHFNPQAVHECLPRSLISSPCAKRL
jgi:hypothetical protein